MYNTQPDFWQGQAIIMIQIDISLMRSITDCDLAGDDDGWRESSSINSIDFCTAVFC